MYPRPPRLSLLIVAGLSVALSTTACADDAAQPTATRAAPATTSAPPVASPLPEPSATGVASTGTAPTPALPDVTGKRLSEGEDVLRAMGFFSVQAVDASGDGRTILEKNNWLIVRQDPAAGSPLPQGLTVTLGVLRPTDRQPAPAVREGVVPKVVCRDLQDAQDALREAGFYLLVPHDGLGQGRLPLLDRNWIVIGQSHTAGSRPERTEKIELTVVKFGEPTGNSRCPS
ncbi:PASTA domain-containing protein [Micromonospora sp. NPDC047644]|uniref:PASTA domain-containing protein n=1 Tax=Micromonospora sp. NPDC047644 TaxID=3157203 RepID=UPI003453E1D5